MDRKALIWKLLQDPPQCAVCGHAVERIVMLPRIKLATQFVVYCHGKEEECELTDYELVNAEDIEIGKAFVTESNRRTALLALTGKQATREAA